MYGIIYKSFQDNKIILENESQTTRKESVISYAVKIYKNKQTQTKEELIIFVIYYKIKTKVIIKKLKRLNM